MKIYNVHALKAFSRFRPMTSISVKQYKGTTGKCQDWNSNFNAVFTSKSFSHFKIVVFVPLLNDL